MQHYFDRGVDYLSLAHFNKNGVAPPCFPYPESLQICGCFKDDRNVSLELTDIGKQMVKKSD